jgi:hypothetical protein
VDTVGPVVGLSSTITTDAGSAGTITSGGLTKDNTLALSGTVSDAGGLARVEIYDGSTKLGDATLNGGNWTFTTAVIADGAHSFTAKAIDVAGNSTTTAAVTATVDTGVPTPLTVGAVATDDTINISERDASGGVTVSGTTEVGSSVKVNGQNATVTGGTWTYSLTDAAVNAFDQGGEVLQIVSTDAAGNTSSTTM